MNNSIILQEEKTCKENNKESLPEWSGLDGGTDPIW